MAEPAQPKVSVVVPVYGGERYLAETLDAVLAQTFHDLELVVVDDASPDRSATIARERAAADPRVRVVARPENGGISRATNTGLDEARGQYVALLDQDDIPLPGRLAAQVEFLDAHPEVGLLGTAFETIDGDGNVLGRVDPPSGEVAIRWWMVFSSPFCAPSVMFRRRLLDETGERFNPAFDLTQDYDFFSRIARHTGVENLPAIHLRYRRHPGQNTGRHFAAQQALASIVTRRELRDFFPNADALDARLVADVRQTAIDGQPRKPAPAQLPIADTLHAITAAYPRHLPGGERERWAGWLAALEATYPRVAIHIHGPGDPKFRSRLEADLAMQVYPSGRFRTGPWPDASWNLHLNERCRVSKSWLEDFGKAAASRPRSARLAGTLEVDVKGGFRHWWHRWQRGRVARRFGDPPEPPNSAVRADATASQAPPDPGTFHARCVLTRADFKAS